MNSRFEVFSHLYVIAAWRIGTAIQGENECDAF